MVVSVSRGREEWKEDMVVYEGILSVVVSSSIRTVVIGRGIFSQIKQIMKENQRPQPALFNYILPIIKKNPSIIFNIEIKSKDINNHLKKLLLL